jgi:hypothetical protein
MRNLSSLNMHILYHIYKCIRVKAGLRERRKEGLDDGGWKEGWREGETSDGSQNPVELHIGSTVAHPQLPKET